VSDDETTDEKQDTTAPEADANLTPMMKQYLEVKAQVPGALLFFRLGDFYELFFDDAVKASALLQITLTARSKGEGKVPMCGVPFHAAKRYIGKLIEAGEKVAICEQVSPPGKGIVKREIVRVVTPGMVLDDDVLSASDANFLAAIQPGADEHSSWGAALLDASTGEFFALVPGGPEGILEELAKVNPREVLLPDSVSQALETLVLQSFRQLPSLAKMPAQHFASADAMAAFAQQWPATSLNALGLHQMPESVGAAAAALAYLKQTQKNDAPHVVTLKLLARGESLILDDTTCTNLELVRNARDGNKVGSLLGVIDKTVTSMGSRTLKSWMLRPLFVPQAIVARHDAVQSLVDNVSTRDRLVQALKGIADLERLAGRLALSAGGPRDLKALERSLSALPEVIAVAEVLKQSLIEQTLRPLRDGTLAVLQDTLARAMTDEPPVSIEDGDSIRKGFDPRLDEWIALSTGAKDYLLQLETRERERTKINSLKVRYNRVFGYFLEVTKSNLHLVPADWERRQTMTGAERYVTEELKTYEERVLTADEKRLALEREIFENLRQLVLAQAGALKAAAEALAVLDVLCCFARVATENNYCRPVIDESPRIELTSARHPVVEQFLPHSESFIANDLTVDRRSAQLLILTGPNMAGKSTVMRQVALAVVMAQMGSFVAAKSAKIGVCDRVFTRVGASDNLARGQSTFMVEMSETARILQVATIKSLIVLDEIGRGTSTYDGLSIAWAVAEHLSDRVGARSLFATHYHELTDLCKERPKVKNLSMAVQEHQGRVIFLRKLVEGAASRSYGIEVARLAGLPPEVLARARELLANLEAGEFDESGRPRLARRAQGNKTAPTAAESKNQLGLFISAPTKPSAADELKTEILEALKSFPLDTKTPLEAMNALAAWRAKLLQ
jgi:DNA mismatch repair protein MutS